MPIEWFDVRHNENNSFEYGIGNVKLIYDLQTIAKNSLRRDIIFFPHGVVEKLLSWHFNVFNLSEDEYIQVTTEFNPYK